MKTDKEQNLMAACEMRRLTLEQIRSIYTGPSERHFPADELKPFALVRALWEDGGYEGLGLYGLKADGSEELAGYAFFIRIPDKDILLLDYYAVMEEYRNGGTGSLFLGQMKELYKDRDAILLETEAPETASDEAERSLRIRRNGFYQRNGAIFTEVRSRLFGVDYHISYIPLQKTLTDGQVKEELDAVYRYMLGEEAYRGNVEL